MTKTPDIKTLVDGYDNESAINYNMRQINEAFENVLAMTADRPNHMDANLDIADATITNVREVNVEVLEVNEKDIFTFTETYVWRILNLGTYETGDFYYAPADDTLDRLPAGVNGQVLKVTSGLPAWGEDQDTDTDTVGVTVQEDGVTVAENVTTINFKWTDTVLVTTPAGNQVDLELTDLNNYLIWEDTDQADTNIDPDLAGGAVETTTLDLFDAINGPGLTAEQVDTQNYFFVTEGAAWLETTTDGGAASGDWDLDITFLESDGVTDAGHVAGDTAKGWGSTGDFSDSTAGGVMMTNFQTIPAGTRYVRVHWLFTLFFPLGLNWAEFANRYRAVVKNPDVAFETPGGVDSLADGDSVNPTTAAKP